MQDDSNKLIQDQFDSLPIENKEALSRSGWRKKVRAIAEREKLSDEQGRALEIETLLVLYQFLNPENFTANVQREVGIDDVQAGKLVSTIDLEVFKEIEKQLDMITALMPKASRNQAPITSAPAPANIPTGVPTEIPPTIPAAPATAPIAPSTPAYMPGKDPYRESFE